MKCPNCGSEILKDCCIKCGYLINGNKINTSNDSEKFHDEKLFNKDFETLYRNKKLLLPFLLGPLYFSYRGYLIFGTILGIIEYFFIYFLFNYILPYILFFNTTPIYYLIFIINRVMYATFANSICLLIDKFKIWYIKKTNKNYIYKLDKYKHRKIYLLITIMIYIIIVVCFALIRRHANGLL